MSKQCFDDITQNCDTCYEITASDCLDISIGAGLTPSTSYWLWCVAPDGNIYKTQTTTDGSGSFVIDVGSSVYPTGLFNKYAGKFEFFISLSQIDSTPEAMSISAVEYNCIVVSWSVNCCDNTYIPPTPCEGLLNSLSSTELNTCILPTYDFCDTDVTDNLTAAQLACIQSDICTGGGGGDVTIKNTLDDFIADVDAPNEYIVPDSSVRNSDGSTIIPIPANTSNLIDDIDIIDSDGTPIVWPSMKDFICTPSPVPSGIAYFPALITGQVTSYFNYDDGWHRQAGTYDYSFPAYPTHYAALDHSDPLGTTLLNNNIFGDTRRFTDLVGTQVYANDIIIDHHTGYAIYRLAYLANDQSDACDTANSATIAGLGGWRVPNVNEANKLINSGLANVIGWSPLNLTTSPERYWTSTRQHGTTNGFILITNGRIAVSSVGANEEYILIRNHLI